MAVSLWEVSDLSGGLSAEAHKEQRSQPDWVSEPRNRRIMNSHLLLGSTDGAA